MKKLFKQLSIVLVLAMVIGLVPARQASAADYSVKLAHKYLFVGGAKGVDANGNLPANPIKKSYKVKINGLEKGDVVTLKSSDKTVAKAANNKYPQRVFAVAPGKAEFTVKVNGAEVGTLKVTVKQNATALEIVDLPENNQFGIGTYEVKVAATPAAATDVVKLVIADEYKDIAVVNEDNTITTKKPGSFKMSAVASQNDTTLPGATAKAEEVECTAAVKVVSATQKSQDQVNFVFDTEMTDIAAAKDFKVYSKLNGADIVVATKSVAVDKEDAKKVTLTLWSSFAENTEYFVEYSGQTSSFKSAKMGAQYAASVRFDETKIVKNVLTEYKFTVLNADGVEMPSSLNANVSFAGTSTDKIQISNSAIIFDAAGLSASVTATFDAWYDDDVTGDSKQNKFTSVALLTSVDADPVVISSYEWTINDNFADYKFDLASYKPVQFIAVEDDSADVGNSSEINFRLTFSDGSEYNNCAGTETAYENPVTEENFASGIVLEKIVSANNNVAVINGTQILAVAPGSTQLLFYVEGKETPVLVVPLEVKAKAVPSTISVVADKTKLNTDTRLASTGDADEFNDEIDFVVSVLDQYGRPFTKATISTTEASKSGNATITKVDKDSNIADVSTYSAILGGYPVVVKATDILEAEATKGYEGVVVLKFTAADAAGHKISNSSKSITAKTVEAHRVSDLLDPETTVSFNFSLVQDVAAVDTVFGTVHYAGGRTVTYDVDDAQRYIEMAPFASNGYQIGAATPVDMYDGTDAYKAVTGSSYAYRLYKGATEITNVSTDKTKSVADGVVSFNTVNSNDELVKAAAGSYTVKLYKIESNGTKVVKESSKDTNVYTVSDSQPTISAKKVEDKVASAGAVASAFEVKYDGQTVAGTFVTADGTKNIFVKSVEYDVVVGGVTFTVSANLGYTLVIE